VRLSQRIYYISIYSDFCKGRAGKNGGVQGEEIFCPRAVFPPPSLQCGAEQKNYLFLLEEKRCAQKLKNVKAIFLRGRPPLCGGWRQVIVGFVS